MVKPTVSNNTKPREYLLLQNYPNPFNPVTEIKYDLPENAHVVLSLFNVLGQEVRTFVDEQQDAGHKTVRFDAGTLPSGVYFYRLQARPIDGGRAGWFVDVKKMVLAK